MHRIKKKKEISVKDVIGYIKAAREIIHLRTMKITVIKTATGLAPIPTSLYLSLTKSKSK